MASERSLYNPIIELFGADYQVYKEVKPYFRDKTYTKRIDLVFRGRNHRLTAVEVKLSDWKRVLRQALLNTCYCHYSYMAVPYSIAVRLDAGLFDGTGVGLIGVDKKESEILVKSRLTKPIKKVEKCAFTSNMSHRKASS